ncbi:MAG: virginiamycin B lyase family protein [Pirellulales bacterium]|jgi:serine/threonine-protein kinase
MQIVSLVRPLVVALIEVAAHAAVPAHGADPAGGLEYPLAVAPATDGSLFVADRVMPGLWHIAEGKATVHFQGSKTFRTPLNAVRTVAVGPDGTVWAGDPATRDVHRVAADGTTQPLTGGKIGIPIDIAVDSQGTLFVSDLETQRVWRILAGSAEPVQLAVLAAPRGLFVDASDQLWAVAASGDAPLVRIAADGTVTPVVKSRAFEFPHDVVVTADGTAYVSDNYAVAVWKVAPDGTVTKWLSGAPLAGPVGLALRNGRVLVADPKARTVFEIDDAGKAVPLLPAAPVAPAAG